VAGDGAGAAGREISRPVLALNLVFRGPPSFHALWALTDDETRLILEDCQTTVRDCTIGWLEDTVAAGAVGERRPAPRRVWTAWRVAERVRVPRDR
jgi:hypothetical protein